MANIPNTTQTPNIIFNGLMREMSDTDLRVVLCVVRATFGWIADPRTGMRKEEDWISHWQLSKKTGRSGRALSTAIDRCIKKNWIEARDENGVILDTKAKRRGQKIYYRIGKAIILTTSENTSEVLVSSEKTSNEKDSIEESSRYKRNSITKEKHIQNIASPSANAERSKIRKGNTEPVSLEEAVGYFRKSPHRHIRVIGDYADAKKPDCRTGGQWHAFMKRNLRIATDLSEFSDEQIEATAKKIWGEEWLKHWTLETLLKYLINNH